MTDETQPRPPTMFHNFNLPHGDTGMDDDGEEQQLIDFEKGISDDEGFKDAFDRSYPGPKSKEPSRVKAKKSPRRSEDDDSSKTSPKTKKPRILSLFGGGSATHSDEDADDEQLQPKTPGQGIGMRMSSLTLEQQDERILDQEDNPVENDEGPFRQKFDMGASLDLSDRADSPALSEHSSKLDDDEYPLLPENPALSYGLRQNIDRTIAAATWIDIDQSGTYDPEADAKQKALKLNKTKAKKKKGKQKAAPREKKIKRIVKLRIQAMGNVLNITNGEDRWPDDYSVFDSEEEREMQERRSFFRRRTPGVGRQEPIPDPKGEFTDLTGHPIARGCIDCRKYDQDCSMITDGEYPCAQCVEDGTDCQPIVEPKIHGQGRCDICEQLGRPCSFEDGGMGTICDQCLDIDNIACNPGPITSYTSDRIDLDTILYGPDRKYANCTYCRTHKKRCSLKKKEDKPPCKYCKKHGIGCTFYELQPLNLSRKGKGKQKVIDAATSGSSRKKEKAAPPEVSIPGSEFFDAEDLADLQCGNEDEYEREETPEMEMEDAEGRRGMMTKIRTSFAHPIKFNTIDNASKICNFCEMPTFGFVGHWEKTIHVIKWHNGLGYTEIAAGHREDYDATLMCQECVMARVQTIYCPEHDINRIDPADIDYDEAVNQLLAADPGSLVMRHELQRWCSMCFSLAVFKCCTPQPDLMNQTEDDEILLEGCGLKFCAKCEEQLREVFFGDVDNMATAFEAKPKAKEGEDESEVVIRADVGFLRKEGLLMANVGFAASGAVETATDMDMEL